MTCGVSTAVASFSADALNGGANDANLLLIASCGTKAFEVHKNQTTGSRERALMVDYDSFWWKNKIIIMKKLTNFR